MSRKKLELNDMTNQEDPYNQFVNNDNREPNDELSLLVVKEIFDKKNRKTMSRIKFEQVSIIAKLFLYGETFGCKFTNKLANHMLDLQISTNGLGRKENVQMVQQRNDFMDLMQEQKKTSKNIFK
jgi:hypothetical protein